MEAQVKSNLECIRRISGVRLLVVGDVMLDTYLDCRALGVADEAPVPLLEIRSQSDTLGGAANVARNLAQLGAQTTLIGVVGDDAQAEIIRGLLRESGVAESLLQTQRQTTVKTRVSSGDHYYLRLDEEQICPLTESDQATVASQIDACLSEIDLLVVSDYDKGFLSPSLAKHIERLARDRDLGIVADLKPQNALNWRHLDLITPNLSEARLLCSLLHPEREPSNDPQTIADTLKTQLGCGVVLKMGSQGMLIAPSSGTPSHLKALCLSPMEVSGAGDTVLATLAASLAQHADLHQAAWLANVAASISVSKPDTHAVSVDELMEAVTQSAGCSL